MAKSSREFDLYSANLALYRPEYAGTFVCPICLRVFPRETMEHITRAHVIPEALGGRLTTITCSDCNSRIGHMIESHETLRAQDIRAVSGVSDDTVDAIVETYDSSGFRSQVTSTMNVRVHGERPSLSFRIVGKASDPRQVQMMQGHMMRTADSGNPDWNFRVTWTQRGVWDVGRLTYLHAGFLMLFRLFGYEWALDPCTQAVREQLARPRERILDPILPKLGEMSEGITDLSVHLITQPREMRGFLVIIPPLSHILVRIGVWFPLFGNRYAACGDSWNTNLRLLHLPDLHKELGDPDSHNWGHYLVACHCI